MDNLQLDIGSMIRKLHPKNNIKKLRKLRGMTAEQLGEAIGVSGPYISMLENRKKGLYYVRVKQIAEALMCHPDDIMDELKEKSSITLSKEEQEWLNTLHDIPEDKRKLYMSMAEPLREDYGHGQPRNKKQNENGNHK